MTTTRKINYGRPLTGVPDELLSTGNVLLSCGEDYPELMDALNINELPRDFHRYRNYSFTRYREFTLVTTGLGSGALDPLLYEILAKTDRLIAFGSARLMQEDPEMRGRAFIVQKAYQEVFLEYAHPRFELSSEDSRMIKVTAISSERFYGTIELDLLEKRSRAERRPFVLDCDTAQLYRLCDQYGSNELKFVAVKGVPHESANEEEILFNTRAILRECGRVALSLLHNG